MDFRIRAYHPSDLSSLYRICLLTADSGADGAHLYDDPDLPGHLFAAPYAVHEPALCFVLTCDGAPCGYVLGTRDTAAFIKWCDDEWLPTLRTRYPRPQPADDSRQARVIRTIHAGFQLYPELDDYSAHLHIDLLPIAQGQGLGREMIEVLLDQLRAMGVTAVHLGVGKANARAVRFYASVGFHVIVENERAVDFGMKL